MTTMNVSIFKRYAGDKGTRGWRLVLDSMKMQRSDPKTLEISRWNYNPIYNIHQMKPTESLESRGSSFLSSLIANLIHPRQVNHFLCPAVSSYLYRPFLYIE